MTFIRGTFIFALAMLGVGAAGGHYLATSLLTNSGGPTIQAAARTAPTATSSPTPKPVRIVPTTKTPVLRRTPTPLPRATATHVATPTSTPAVAPSPTPLPTATLAAPGTVALGRYWLDSSSVRAGRLVAFGYTIENPTRSIVRVVLGASIKPSRVPSWAVATISDSFHDVTASVAPGLTTHLRYFTVPVRARPGSYDVAWGLKNTVTGASVGLATVSSALTVTR